MDKAKAESEVEIMNERKVCLITGGGKALLKDGKPGAIGYLSLIHI